MITLCAPQFAAAEKPLPAVPDPDPAIEMAALELPEGFEINLYASDPLIAKPIQMNFDSEGRLWLACSEMYPHIEPGQVANDKILVLEDADGDGAAEKTTVFADGLLIPTAVIPAHGGAYVANSTELLFFGDINGNRGDRVADERQIVLSGFGTEDTHHLIHTLRWGFDGRLYFNQSIYIHSHVETPHGVVRLGGGGFWQFDPESLRLRVLATGMINPWGLHWDRWGQCFATDGAGGEGINYVFPGAAFPTAVGAERVIHGLNPGSPKYCGLEVTSGRHLPDDWQQNLLTCDFRAHRVCRFVLSDQGSGYVSRELPELIKSTHPAFRPVDVKMGPDGAIYVADWYNPIIQHGEVDFRDPRRDHTHGRIWRITCKDRPLVERRPMQQASLEELLEALKTPEDWTRQFARLELQGRAGNSPDHAAHMRQALDGWVQQLAASDDPQSSHHLLEALWTCEALRQPSIELLKKLLADDDFRVRAAAARMAGYWHREIAEPVKLLAPLARDEHARVRLEAICALRAVGTNEAALAAFQALDYPLDENLDFALWQIARELAPAWLTGVGTRQRPWRGSVEQLLFALAAVDSAEVAPLLLELLAGDKVPPEKQVAVIEQLSRLGSAEQLRVLAERLLGDSALGTSRRAALLGQLAAITAERNITIDIAAAAIEPLLASDSPELQAAAALAIGAWSIEELSEALRELAESDDVAASVRIAAIESLVSFEHPQARDALEHLAASAQPPRVRLAAIVSLLQVAPQSAARHAIALLAVGNQNIDPAALLQPFLARKDGPALLIAALPGIELPGDVAKLAVRAVQSSPQPDEALLAALRAAGGLAANPAPPTPEELAALVRDVNEWGDAALGENVYRRRDLACQKCHAIAGAGGLVGPDLLSIGASAPVDYLVESILDPNKKIKENYHSLIVVTEEGQIFNGIAVRETDRALILRDAEGRETAVPLESIEQRAQGQSLMPAGAAEALTREELVHLVRFLSELGKGEYAASPQDYVRVWETMQMTPEGVELLRRTRIGTAASGDPAITWEPLYSRVSGELPIDELPTLASLRGKYVHVPPLAIVRFMLRQKVAGEVKLLLNSATGLTMWLDGEPLAGSGQEIVLPLAAGEHYITLAVDTSQRSQPLRIERKATAAR